MREHWHFHDNTDNEDPMVSEDIYTIFVAVSDELRDLADFHYQGISGAGDNKLYGLAFDTFKAWETIKDLKLNVDNVIQQHKSPIDDRSPLFRHQNPIPNDYDESSDLYQTALWVVSLVNRDTGMEIYSCKADDIIGDEDGTWHESYFPAGG